MITGTGLVTRGLVEGLGGVGLASRGLITAVEGGPNPPPGQVEPYQPRHWNRTPSTGGARYRRRNQ